MERALKAYLAWSAAVLLAAYAVPYAIIRGGGPQLYTFWTLLTLAHYLVTVSYIRGWVRNE